MEIIDVVQGDIGQQLIINVLSKDVQELVDGSDGIVTIYMMEEQA